MDAERVNHTVEKNNHSVIHQNPHYDGFMKFAHHTFDRMQQFREQAYCPDVRLVADDKMMFPAHRISLAAHSDFFYELFKRTCCTDRIKDPNENYGPFDCPHILTVKLQNCDGSSLRLMLDFVYSGILPSSIGEIEKSALRQLAKSLKIQSLEEKLDDLDRRVANGNLFHEKYFDDVSPIASSTENVDPSSLSNESGKSETAPCILPAVKTASTRRTLSCGHDQEYDCRQCAKSFNDSVTMPPPDIPPRKRRLIEDNTAAPEAPTPKSGDRERSEATNETPSTSKLTIDQDTGWCRNRKYIESTKDGFQCRLCKKTYHRYNSTSYHVTIYHRNPPIKCDQEDCTFATREARYIHFHKFYRHHIPLPDNIEVDSRQCPFCSHIAKSPAMLEKHINRHLPDCIQVGKTYHCQVCNEELTSGSELIEHMWIHQEQKSYPCEQCQYIGRSAANLRQHQSIKHCTSDADLMSVKHKCNDCSYQSASAITFAAHRRRAHGSATYLNTGGMNETEEENEISASGSAIEAPMAPPPSAVSDDGEENGLEVAIVQSKEEGGSCCKCYGDADALEDNATLAKVLDASPIEMKSVQLVDYGTV